MVLGELDVAQVKSPWLYKVAYQCMERMILGRIPPASDGHQLPEGGSGSAAHLMDDVHQARIA